MQAVLFLAMQAAVATPEAPVAVLQSEFDLASLARAPAFNLPCAASGADVIVVCARRRGGAYPMDQWERVFAVAPLVAETRLAGNASVRAYTESVAIGMGQTSNRAMIGVRLPF